MVVTELPSRQVLGLNQRTYQRLKLTLQLNLKRQLLIAVCDDMRLRDRLATQLEAEIAAGSDAAATTLEGWQEHQRPLQCLQLDPKQPHLPQQIVACIQQQRLSDNPPTGMSLQVLGIEQLTRQSATTQRQFLRSLRQVELLLPALEHSLLLWMPWPWIRLIQQSLPSFWACHTGFFEFVGDPTPLAPLPEQPSATLPLPGKAATSRYLATRFGSSLADTSPPPTETLASVVPATEITLEELELAELETVIPEPLVPIETDLPSRSQALSPAADAAASSQTRQETATAVALLPKPPSALTQEVDPAAGNAYLQLGQVYRDRLVAGDDDGELLVAAIQAYEEGLRWLPEHSPLWSDSLNDLGSLYWIKAQRTSAIAEALPLMEQAIRAYQQALNTRADQTPEATGRLYSNLAAAHSFLANFQTPLSHLTQAVDAYHQALNYRSAETAALEYSSLQNSLGAAHWRLAQQASPRQHLQQAIAAYTEALQYCQPHQEPLRYAMIENNLGVAYWSLAQHHQPVVSLEQAIAAYQKALVYRTPEIDAAACAATQNNLGTAYCELASHQKQVQQRDQLWQQAIAAYSKTLNVLQLGHPQASAQSLDLYSVHYSLGVVHGYLGASGQLSETEQTHHLTQGLQHYLTAWEGWQTSPEARETTLQAIANNLRLQQQQLGIARQQQALQQIPAHLLPELLPKL